MISTNEIKQRAVAFSKEWEHDFNERAEAKTFMDSLFNVFGLNRRRVGANFEESIKKEDGKQGFIDLLYKKYIIIEFKSRGKDLSKAHSQARDYFPGIDDKDLPRYILVCDFQKFKLYDLEDRTDIEFELKDFVKNIEHFNFLIDQNKVETQEQNPVNIKAAEAMGALHDSLEVIGYNGHPLEVLLVRILFCLFAEDTTIFSTAQFRHYIEQRTNVDGSDLAAKLQELFQVLNTDYKNRFKNLDEQLVKFPYVNGKLFEEILPMASFDSNMRNALLKCCNIDWSGISPAIFGSMFQSVMNKEERRNLGAHYTSEKNILKVIKPLFLDELWDEFENIKNNKNKLIEFQKKLSQLNFLDPACGCGNFLVITYREIRLLELEVIKAINKSQQGVLNINDLVLINVDQMIGIEIKEFPARIAEVAMWLIDHQMNMLVGDKLGQYFLRLPLKKAARIHNENALVLDWNNIQNKSEIDYIIGNPPFIGSRIMTKIQKEELQNVFKKNGNTGELDYVCGWYLKSADFIKDTKIKVGLVSTNSIVQGVQTSILWKNLFDNYNIRIHFAHQTFKWNNEAKRNAAVYCVIIGFASFDIDNKIIYEYSDIKGEPAIVNAKNINAYLVDSKNIFIDRRSKPISKVPGMNFGNMPADGGEFLFTKDEKELFVNNDPKTLKYFRRFISAKEFLNNEERWCLWLKNVPTKEWSSIKSIKERVEKVKEIREISSRPKLALIPNEFAQITQPLEQDYILIPIHTSENRRYIPIGFFNNENISANSCLIIPNGTLFHFGVLSSLIHMSFVKAVCGRLESRYRYSKDIVYNNFPWPTNLNEKQIHAVQDAAKEVLEIRKMHPESSLSELYNPLAMEQDLLKAHIKLDKAVDSCYRKEPFKNDSSRLEVLFELYNKRGG